MTLQEYIRRLKAGYEAIRDATDLQMADGDLARNIAHQLLKIQPEDLCDENNSPAANTAGASTNAANAAK